MDLAVKLTTLEGVLRWRDCYRQEMNCQIVHDSIHARAGWSAEYALSVDGAPVGYGSVAIGGPWKDGPAIYEFYVLPQWRWRLFDLFAAFVETCGANLIETQSNDSVLSVLLHTFGKEVSSQSILFHDRLTTALAPAGAAFRIATAADFPDISAAQLASHGVVEADGKAVGKGGILFHYNRPYGDIYMEVDEGFRGRGFGSYLVQELKRVCHAQGSVPSARCNPKNIASRKTLQKAGFVPCGHILGGVIA